MDSENNAQPPKPNLVTAVPTQLFPGNPSSATPVAVDVQPVAVYPVSEVRYPQQAYLPPQAGPAIPTAAYVSPQYLPGAAGGPPYATTISSEYGVVNRRPSKALPEYFLCITLRYRVNDDLRRLYAFYPLLIAIVVCDWILLLLFDTRYFLVLLLSSLYLCTFTIVFVVVYDLYKVVWVYLSVTSMMTYSGILYISLFVFHLLTTLFLFYFSSIAFIVNRKYDSRQIRLLKGSANRKNEPRN